MARRVLFLISIVLFLFTNSYSQGQFRGVVAGTISIENSILRNIAIVDSLGIVTILTTNPKNYGAAVFSPEGENIVYSVIRDTIVTPDDIGKLNLLPKNLEKALNGVDFPKLAPDGVNYIFKVSDIYVMNIKTREESLVSDGNLLAMASPQSWSSNSKKVYSIVYRPYGVAKGPNGNIKGEIWETDIKTKVNKQIQIKLGPEFGLRVDLSSPLGLADTNKIIFSNIYYGGNSKVFIKNLETEDIFHLYDMVVGNNDILYSPGSNWLSTYNRNDFLLFNTDKTSQLRILNLRQLLATINIHNFEIEHMFWAPDGKSFVMRLLINNNIEFFILSRDLKEIKKLNIEPRFFPYSWGGYPESRIETPIEFQADLIRYYNSTEYSIFILLSLAFCFWFTTFLVYKNSNIAAYFVIPFTILPTYYILFQFEPGVFLNLSYISISGITVYLGLKLGNFHVKEVFSSRKELLVNLLDFGHSGKVTRNIEQLILFLTKLVEDGADSFAIDKYVISWREFNLQSSREIRSLSHLAKKCRYGKSSKEISKSLNNLIGTKELFSWHRHENIIKDKKMLIKTLSNLQISLKQLEYFNDKYFLTDVCKLLNNLLLSYNDSFIEKGIEKIKVENKDVSIRIAKIEEKDLMFILDNLLDNACKSILESEKVEKKVIINLSSNKNRFFIRVKDNGVGISKDDFEKIFYPGVSGTNGTGYGLYRSRELLVKYRGIIELEESQLGIGTTFLLVLKMPSTNT